MAQYIRRETATCVEPGCDEETSRAPGSRGAIAHRCPPHRDARRKQNDRQRVAQRTPRISVGAPPCGRCGQQVAEHFGSGPQASYCSATCRNAASYARRRAAGTISRNRQPKPPVQCECSECGARFESRVSARFCSGKCATRSRRRDGSPCSIDGCDRGVDAKGLCAKHWRAWARASGREKPEPWNERRKEAYDRRRARKASVDAEKVDREAVYERDGWLCGLCSEPVDQALSWPDPMSKSLDHIVPLSLGGAHRYDNVQCAHLVCNVQKGNRVEVSSR